VETLCTYHSFHIRSNDNDKQIVSDQNQPHPHNRINILREFELIILLIPDSLLVKVSAAVGAVLGLADVAMHSCICSVTGVCTLADKATHSYICSVTSVCIYSVYKHVAPTFSDINHQPLTSSFVQHSLCWMAANSESFIKDSATSTP
jgi:hypothetical protein